MQTQTYKKEKRKKPCIIRNDRGQGCIQKGRGGLFGMSPFPEKMLSKDLYKGTPNSDIRILCTVRLWLPGGWGRSLKIDYML